MENIPRSPLQWPVGQKRTQFPRDSKFGRRNSEPGNWKPMRKLTIDEASRFLSEEVRRLTGDDDFILSTNLKYKQDGMPYSNQRQPDDQGVAVYFDMDDGNGGYKQTVIACDSFNKIGCNIYAIAKTIEAMRSIERNGCSELMNKAFTGFQGLPEKGSGTTWWDFMEIPQDSTQDIIKSRYKALCKTMHPDAGGSTTMFQMLQDIYKQAMAKFKS